MPTMKLVAFSVLLTGPQAFIGDGFFLSHKLQPRSGAVQGAVHIFLCFTPWLVVLFFLHTVLK